MSKESGVIWLGFLVVILPMLGFPESWRMIFFFLVGVALIVIGFMMRSQTLSRRYRNSSKTFVQSDVRVNEPVSPGEQGKQENAD